MGAPMAIGDRRVVDGVEYEVIWDGSKGAKGLSSDWFTDSSLGQVGRDADRAMRLGRQTSTLLAAKRELDILWAEDET